MTPHERKRLSPEERRLSADNIEALRRLKQANLSVEQIHRFTGFSVGVVTKYTADVEPNPQYSNQDNGTGNDPTLTSQQPTVSQSNDGGVESPQPLQPHVIKPHLNQPEPQVETPPREDANPRPDMTRPTVNGSDELNRIFADAALSRGYLSVREYVSEVILPDVRFAGLVKEAIPHVDIDSLERNFLATVEDANAFRRLTRTSKEEARREIMEKRKDGNPA